MVLVKILKRRDAASVVVAIIIAMIISSPISSATVSLANKISGVSNGGYNMTGGGWKNEYLFPVVWAILQLIILEILGWIYVLTNRPIKHKR